MDVSFSGLFSSRIVIVAPEFFLDTHGNVIERHVFPVLDINAKNVQTKN